MQVSRSQRILRAQDLLAVSCFIQNGEFYQLPTASRHTTHLHPPDISDLTDQHLTLSGLKGRVSLGPVVAPLVSTRTAWPGCHPGNWTNDPPWSVCPDNIFRFYENTNFSLWIIGNVRVWHNITHNWGCKIFQTQTKYFSEQSNVLQVWRLKRQLKRFLGFWDIC